MKPLLRLSTAALAAGMLASLLASCSGSTTQPANPSPVYPDEETVQPGLSASVPAPSESPLPVLEPNNAARLAKVGQAGIDAEGISALAWSPDGATIAVATANGVFLFDTVFLQQNGQLAAGEAIQSLVYSPDGRLLVTIPFEQNATAQIWDTTSRQEANLLAGRLGGVRSVAFSAERSMIATGGLDGVVTLWDWDTQQLIRNINLNATVGDITGGQIVGVGDLRFSPDGTILAGAGDLGSGILILWSTNDGSVQRTLTAMGHIAGPAATPLLPPDDWNHVYWWSRGSIIQVDVSTDQEGLRFSHEDFVASASFSPDGLILATASAGTVHDGYAPLVKLWDVSGGQELVTLTGFSNVPTALGFSPDGRLLAIASNEDGLTIGGVQP